MRHAALLLLLAGCSTQWTRDDFSAPQAEQDEAGCRLQAAQEVLRTPTEFHGTLNQYYGPNYQPYGRTRTISTPGPMFDADPAGARLMAEDRLIDECMRGKGYRPKN